MCTYVYTHTRIDIYISALYTCIDAGVLAPKEEEEAYIHIYIYVCVYTCMYVYVYVHVHV